MRAEFHRQIHPFDSLDSTNLKAKEFIQAGAPVGTTIVARVQTAGRGRADRKWHSPEGGLYFSVLLIPAKPSRATDLSILAGAAVAQTVKQILPKECEISLKWPNDLLIGKRKVAGILSEWVGDEIMGMCVVGIGINVNVPESELEPFAKNPFPATSLLVELPGAKVQVDAVLDTALTKLESLYIQYMELGFDSIRRVWEDNCRMMGKRVQIEKFGFVGMSEPATSRPVQGEFRGLDPTGAMVVRLSGKDIAFHAGEITCFWP